MAEVVTLFKVLPSGRLQLFEPNEGIIVSGPGAWRRLTPEAYDWLGENFIPRPRCYYNNVWTEDENGCAIVSHCEYAIVFETDLDAAKYRLRFC